MTEIGGSSWSGDYQHNQYPGGNEVTFATLQNPPSRGLSGRAMTSLLTTRAETLKPDWEPRDVTDSSDNFHGVRMNSCAAARFGGPGYLGVATLNGCMAVAAAYREVGGTVPTFYEHYDLETARTVGGSGKLKMSELLAGFAGQQPVRVAIAYAKPRFPHPIPYSETASPEDYPVEAFVEGCQELPHGSSVLLIPYETSDDPAAGHMLYVGHTLTGRIDFGWNGHSVTVGEPEQADPRRIQAARDMAAAWADEAEREYRQLD